MKKYLLSVIMCITISTLAFAQVEQLKAFENLVNKSWEAKGNWGNGLEFRQEVHFSYGLNKTIIIADSKGFLDEKQTTFGDRNHGIRQFNASNNSVEFWEFDVFGGVTKGKVNTDGKSIWYVYKYGESIITDYWEYVDDETYNFIVGNFENGKWTAKYLETQFKLK